MGGQAVSQQAKPQAHLLGGLDPEGEGAVAQVRPDGRIRMGMLFLLAYKRNALI